MSDEPKRLFEVELTLTVYVAAEDAAEAERVAEDAHRAGEFNDLIDAAYVCPAAAEVGDVRRIPSTWRTALPWAAESEYPLTCAQTVEAWQEYERTRPRTRAELEAAGQRSLLAPQAGA